MRFGSRGPSEVSAVGLWYVTEMAFEDAVQGLAKQAQRLGEGGQNHDETTPFPSLCLAPFSRAPHFS